MTDTPIKIVHRDKPSMVAHFVSFALSWLLKAIIQFLELCLFWRCVFIVVMFVKVCLYMIPHAIKLSGLPPEIITTFQMDKNFNANVLLLFLILTHISSFWIHWPNKYLYNYCWTYL